MKAYCSTRDLIDHMKRSKENLHVTSPTVLNENESRKKITHVILQ